MTVKKLSLLFFLPIALLAGSPLSKARADYAFLLADDAGSTIGKSSRHFLTQFKDQLRIRSSRLSADYAPRFSDFEYLVEELEYASDPNSKPHVLYVGLPSSYSGGMLHFDFDGEKVSIDRMWQEMGKYSSEFLMLVEMPPQTQRPANMLWPSQVPPNITFIGAESSTKLQSEAAGVNHPYASDFALTFFFVLAESGQDQQMIGVRDVTEKLRNRLEPESVWSNVDKRDKGWSLPTFIASDGSYYGNWLASNAEERRARQLAAQKAKEAEERRQRELAAQRAKEAEERRQRELAARRAKEAEDRRQRELAAQRAKEAEERRQRELAAQRAGQAENQRNQVAKSQRNDEQRAQTQEGLASAMGGSPEEVGTVPAAPPEGGNLQYAQAMARLKALEEAALKKEKELEELKKQEAAAKKKRKNTTSFGF